MNRVRVGGGHRVRARRMYSGMDRECSRVYRPVALDHFAAAIHQHQIGNADVTEIDAKRVHPETLRIFRIAGGDMAGYAFVKPVAGKQAESRRKAFLSVAALRRRCGEHRRRRQIADPPRSFGHWAGFDHLFSI